MPPLLNHKILAAGVRKAPPLDRIISQHPPPPPLRGVTLSSDKFSAQITRNFVSGHDGLFVPRETGLGGLMLLEVFSDTCTTRTAAVQNHVGSYAP